VFDIDEGMNESTIVIEPRLAIVDGGAGQRTPSPPLLV